MDRIDIYAGGQEFHKQDFDFFQNAIRNAFKNNNSLNSKNYIIEGCEFSGDSISGWSLTKGLCVLDGEICEVDAKTYPANPFGFLNPSFVVSQTVEKQKTNKDGQTRDVRLIRKAEVISTLGGGIPLHRMDNVWRTVGNDGGYTTLLNGFNQEVGRELQYRRMGTTVELRGGIEKDSLVNPPVTIFVLPAIKPFNSFTNDYDLVGFRPSRDYLRRVTTQEGDSVHSIKIDTVGNVVITKPTGNLVDKVSFDGISFDLN